MKVVVMGGTGLVGSRLVASLTARGHEAVAASPSSGVDLLTGAGLPEALQGAQVVVDVTNSPSFAPADVLAFFRTGTANLLAAERDAGVEHHVALSIVGLDRAEGSGYLMAKVAQEALIADSGVPYSILRATQFFEFLRGIADTATVDRTVRVTSATLQPLAVDDVVAALTDVVLAPPTKSHAEVGGPERLGLDVLVRRVLEHDGDTRTVVADHTAGYFGAVIDDDTLTTSDPAATIGATSFDAWLAAR